MVVCPIAIAIGCRKCPIFSVCPAKGVIGDYCGRTPTPRSPCPRSASRRRKRRSKPKARAMVYRWLADATVALHLAFILFVVLGGLLALKTRGGRTCTCPPSHGWHGSNSRARSAR